MAMTSRQRKAALVEQGTSQAAIARATGFSDAYVSDVLRGVRRSDLIEQTVAATIGRPVKDVFPPREIEAPVMLVPPRRKRVRRAS